MCGVHRSKQMLLLSSAVGKIMLFTKDFSVQCLAFAPQLVSVLSKGVDPKKACTAIKLCTNSTGTAVLPPCS